MNGGLSSGSPSHMASPPHSYALDGKFVALFDSSQLRDVEKSVVRNFFACFLRYANQSFAIKLIVYQML